MSCGRGFSSLVVVAVFQVLALDVAATVVGSRQLHPVFVHAPADASLPATGGLALRGWRKGKERREKGEKGGMGKDKEKKELGNCHKKHQTTNKKALGFTQCLKYKVVGERERETDRVWLNDPARIRTLIPLGRLTILWFGALKRCGTSTL